LGKLGVIVLGCGLALPLAAADRFAGRSVSSVLLGLQDAKLQFLFSNVLVPDTLPVLNEPRGRDRLGIARELLAPHGLTIRAVTPSLYIVVRSSADERSRSLNGRIVDAESGDALSGARVELSPLGRVAWSDAAGRFRFDDLATGESYELYASLDSYARGAAPLRIEGDAPAADNTIRLHRAALDTVVVEASRYALAADSPTESHRLEAVELTNYPDIADDPIRALRRLPGVAQGTITAASHLRGGETHEVLVLLDGFPLRQLFHLPGYQSPFSVLDEDSIGNIEVFTGGFPARYGNRLAGVFDIATTEPELGRSHSVGVSFFNAHARTSGMSATGDTSWRAAGRVGTLRPVLQSLSVDAGQPSYSDMSLSGTHRMSDQLVLKAHLLWAADEYALDDDDENAEIASRTSYGWLRADYAFSEDLATSWWLGHSRLAIDRAGAVDKPEFAISEVSDHRAANFWDARANLSWQWSDVSRLNTGFEWTRAQADYRYDGEVTFAEPLAELFGREAGFVRHARLEPVQRRIALFATQRWKFQERVTTEIGLRMQDVQLDGERRERTWDPRVSTHWEIQPRTRLRAHWGRFHQADEVHELPVEDGVGASARAARRALDSRNRASIHQRRGDPRRGLSQAPAAPACPIRKPAEPDRGVFRGGAGSHPGGAGCINDAWHRTLPGTRAGQLARLERCLGDPRGGRTRRCRSPAQLGPAARVDERARLALRAVARRRRGIGAQRLADDARRGDGGRCRHARRAQRGSHACIRQPRLPRRVPQAARARQPGARTRSDEHHESAQPMLHGRRSRRDRHRR
jgi:outer membrane cobalamin receptor